ncbi:MAG: response regulator [Spirochaetaceae bacterium]|nr:response regulator [Spirochaetaceae bacterium]
MISKKTLSLRASIILLFIIGFLIFTVIVIVIAQGIIPTTLIQSEKERAYSQQGAIKQLFEAEQRRIAIHTEDIAVWIDTVRFIKGEYPQFIETTWKDSSPAELYKVNFVFINDTAGNTVYAEGYDFMQRQPLAIPAGFFEYFNSFSDEALKRYHALEAAKKDGQNILYAGILFYSTVPYFFSIMPVIPMTASEPAGTLVFITVLNNEYLQSITGHTDMSFKMSQEPEQNPPENSFISLKTEIVLPSLSLSDVFGNPIYLHIKTTVSLYSQGKKTLNLIETALISGFIIFSLILYALIVRYFIKPIERLIADIYQIDPEKRIAADDYALNTELQLLTTSINTMLQKIEQSTISSTFLHYILNEIDACIIITDMNTDELLFFNNQVKKQFHFDDEVIGSICWKVMQKGMTERCPFCPVPQILEHKTENNTKSLIYEQFNSVTNRYYRVATGIINWVNGKQAVLQHLIDITDLKEAESLIKRRLQQQKLLAAIAQSFVSSENLSDTIENTLMMLGMFLQVTKLELARVDKEKQKIVFEYTWHNEGHRNELLGHSFYFGPGQLLYDSFVTSGDVYYICDDCSQVPGVTMSDPGIVKSSAIIPVITYNSLWGILFIEECQKQRSWDESDIQVFRLIASSLAGSIIRRQAEEQLMRMSYIVNSSPQYIAYITPAGQYEYFNSGASVLTGYSSEELMEGGLYFMFDDETVHLIKKTYIPIIYEKGYLQIDLPVRRKDNERRTFSFTIFTVTSNNDRIGIIGLDITEKHLLQQELIAAKELAEQSNKAKTSFLSRMSHEMRTPMNAIIGMTAIAQASHDKERMEYCLNKINDASIHLLGVINDILDMSKIEAGKFELSYSEFNFEKMLLRVTNVMNFRIDEKQQNFVVHLDRTIPKWIYSDEQRLAQVITNLLSNAVKFTPENGSITLSVEDTTPETMDRSVESNLRITVVDTGIGISHEQQKRLFTSFEQADGSIARKFGGTGLGLAISKNIVDLMGGAIWIESEEGKGAAFIVEITVAVRQVAEETVYPIDWHKLRVLVVDDSPDILEYFKYFAETIHIQCITALSGAEACRILEHTEPFDIIFVDWRMPVMNGIELTQKIKHDYKHKAVVIMISATEWATLEDEAKKAGVDGFIAKPLFPSVLVNCINDHLSMRKSTAPISEQEQQSIIEIFAGLEILLAEDVEINQEIVIALLEETGVTVTCADNGLKAVEMFAAAPARYALVLMDISMPEMDGFEATKRIRALSHPQAKTVPIIAMTANVFREDIEQCLASGMNDHLGKPIDIEEMMTKLKHYLL